MKRHISKLLIMLFLLNNTSTAEAQSFVLDNQNPQTPVETVYKEANYQINYINPTVANNLSGAIYPGQRGSNQLIVYTPEYGDRTGTNEFGSEAIVVNGVVTQINGADSIIPRNGFVISGHGSAKKWINENITVGTNAFVDTKTNILKIYINSNSFVFGAEEKVKEVLEIMHFYEMNNPCYDRKTADNYLKYAKHYLKKAEKKDENVQKYAAAASSFANEAIKLAMPYDSNELKGIWIRPTETSEAQIIASLDKIKSAGIDNIFLETYFHGKTIYPSAVLQKYGATNQNEAFVGFDPLEIWVREAHCRGMKVNIWFETFYVGNKYSVDDTQNILNIHPEWGNKTKAKYDSTLPVASLSEHNGFFIDPANPAVQGYLLEIINEIITKYCPDGINLDYIRYPQSIAAKFNGYENSNWGYTDYAREEFKKSNCIDPIEIKNNTPEWYKWAKYRQDKVTNFVMEVQKITRANNISLTAVIFPDRQKSLETKMQDWRSWSIYGYIDGFTPLILTCDSKTASLLINDIKKNSSPATKVYPGLFVTFMSGSTDDLLRQIHESRKLCSQGIILFDYAHLEQKYIDTVMARVFNPNAEIVRSSKPQKTSAKKRLKWKKTQ